MRLHWLPNVSVELQIETPILIFLFAVVPPEAGALALSSAFLAHPVKAIPRTAKDIIIPKTFFINPPKNKET